MASTAVKRKKKPVFLRKQDVVDVLNQEITWHRRNRGGSGCNESYENGFITGLHQARYLIRKLLGDEQ